ncbi:MAG: iron ABC transporter permease [Chloroflexi bacterium]|nr:iron ABC transporter permease [Chloroflexota bacterium]
MQAAEGGGTPAATSVYRRGQGARAPGPPVFVWAPAVLVAAGVALPLAYLVVRTLGSGAEAWELLARGRTLAILGRSLLLALVVTGATVAIGLPLAWLTVRTDLPLRRVWSVLTALPLVIPSYVIGFVVVAALGPRGMLQGLLAGPLGVERLPEIYGFPGAALSLSLVSFPYVLLGVRGALARLDPALEEAARSLGHGGWATFRKVTLPLLRPALAAGALLVALYTLSDFGAVSMLRYETFTWAIYLQYQTSFDRSLAAALSLVLVVIAVAILAIEAQTRGRSRYYRSTAGAVRPAAAVRLGGWRWPALAFCSVVALFALALPLAVLGYWLARGLGAGETLHLLWGPMVNSAYASGLAAVATVAAALPVVFLAVRYRSLVTALLERMTYVGFALPGIAIALSLVFFGANYLQPLYQSLALLVFAYLVLFLPTAVGAERISLLQVRPSLEEAARSLGRPPLQVLARVTIPLMRPGIAAGAALVFLLTMKELPATLILGPIGFKTLATSLWSSASEGFFARAAAPALLLVLASSVPLAILTLRARR